MVKCTYWWRISFSISVTSQTTAISPDCSPTCLSLELRMIKRTRWNGMGLEQGWNEVGMYDPKALINLC